MQLFFFEFLIGLSYADVYQTANDKKKLIKRDTKILFFVILI